MGAAVRRTKYNSNINDHFYFGDAPRILRSHSASWVRPNATDECVVTNNPIIVLAPTTGEEVASLWIVAGNPRQDRLQDGGEGSTWAGQLTEVYAVRRQRVRGAAGEV